MPDAPEAKVRARAGAIGFPEAMADTPVANLSGGEKSRLLLGLATFDGAHLVVLDEPTNHLDIDSRAALIEAINDYPGAVILVSHDRYLLEACAERLWLVADGGVSPFEGDLDDYRKLVLGRGAGTERDGADRSEGRASRSDQRRAAAEKRAELAPLKRKITAAEREIARLTARLGELDGALAAPDLYARDQARAVALAKERAEAAAALAAAEDEWLALSGEYESAAAE
jgi:ATP-binding cassette subfamily F protein 3